MSSRFVRSRDLKARGIVNNWAQLDNLIEKYDFPPGRMLSPNTRAWDEEEEVEPWLASRPTEGPPPRAAPRRPPRAAHLRTASGKPPPSPDRTAADALEAPSGLNYFQHVTRLA